MKRCSPLVGLIGITLVANAALADESGRLDEKVIWSWIDPGFARFVPETLLHRLDIDELPIREIHRKRLESALRQAHDAELMAKACAQGSPECPKLQSREEYVEQQLQKFEWDSVEQREGIRRIIERHLDAGERRAPSRPEPCEYASNAGIYEPKPEPFDFEEHLALNAAVFVGRVVDTVVGWSTRTTRVGTMVYVEVEEVFRDEHGVLWPGKLVAYEQPAGEIRLRGARLCTIPEPGRTLVGAGDRVLAFGVQHAADHLWSELSWVYTVRDGEIMPQPEVPDSGIEPVPLARFRALSAR